MGVYVYKISSKPCMTLNGRKVYKATYAYKPHTFGGDVWKENQKLAFLSGVTSCHRYWDGMSVAERTNVLVLHHNRVYEVARCTGSVYDDRAFDKEPYVILETVS